MIGFGALHNNLPLLLNNLIARRLSPEFDEPRGFGRMTNWKNWPSCIENLKILTTS